MFSSKKPVSAIMVSTTKLLEKVAQFLFGKNAVLIDFSITTEKTDVSGERLVKLSSGRFFIPDQRKSFEFKDLSFKLKNSVWVANTGPIPTWELSSSFLSFSKGGSVERVELLVSEEEFSFASAESKKVCDRLLSKVAYIEMVPKKD